jgi:hypothetical protein
MLVAPKPYPSPSSYGGSRRHHEVLAAEALLDMSWAAAEHGQGTVQQQSVRTAAQQRSAVDSPAAHDQPAEAETAEAKAEAAKEEAATAAAEAAAAARAVLVAAKVVTKAEGLASSSAARVVAGEAKRAALARGAASGAYARRWRMQVAEHVWPVHAQPLVQPLGWPAVAVALLGCPSARDSPEMVADISVKRQHVAAHTVQEAVKRVPDVLGSTPARKDRSGSEREESHLANHGKVGMTRGQQALYVARHRMQISCTDAEINQLVQTLALALGATRPENATLKALFAVLVHLNRPDMSAQEVCASTGASLTNLKRWRNRVLNA